MALLLALITSLTRQSHQNWGKPLTTQLSEHIKWHGFWHGIDYVGFDSSDLRNQSSNFEQPNDGWIKTQPELGLVINLKAQH